MSLQLDQTKTALVLIDLQHGIVALPVQPHAASKVVEKPSSMADSFWKKGSPVVYVRVDLANMLPVTVDVSHSDPNAVVPLSHLNWFPTQASRRTICFAVQFGAQY